MGGGCHEAGDNSASNNSASDNTADASGNTADASDILDDLWTLHFHDPYDASWTCSSYLRLCDVGSVSEYVGIFDRARKHMHQGMFFLFRESVFPCWDDPANIQGGCLSVKVPKANLAEYWFQLCARLLGEELLKQESRDRFGWDAVTGVSTSPKRSFCIVKIWVRTDALNCASMFNLPDVRHGEVLFRSNRSNIDSNNARAVSGHQRHTEQRGRRAPA